MIDMGPPSCRTPSPEPDRRRRCSSLFAWTHLIFCIGLLVIVSFTGISEPLALDSGKHTGSAVCRKCHERFYQLWSTSNHGLAMQPYTDYFASTRLKPKTEAVAVGQYRYKAQLGPGPGCISEQGPEGEKRYPVAHVMGGKNVYYFLTPMERGRLQTLPIAYDVRRGEWFDVASSGVRHISDIPLDWKDPAYTFNTACYSCHVSQLSTNYDLKKDTYDSRWSEPGINCETCHGPGKAHVQVCLAAPGGKTPSDLKIIRGGRDFAPGQQNDACAVCHAKMMVLTDTFQPGQNFYDHFDLITLESPDFYPDGRDLGENYSYTQWRMSPCVKSGQLSCLHCHTPSGRFIQKDNPNEACLPCHGQRVQNAAEHSHHPSGSAGSRCINCHMPTTEFARMQRTDHSMRAPAPAATLNFNSPNACNLCHRDKDAAWADSLVRKWHFRDYQAGMLHQAGLVQAARTGDWTQLIDILDYIGREDHDEIFTVSLIRLLSACQDPRIAPVLLRALEDRSPLVRSAAAEGLRLWPSTETARALLNAAGDSRRLVRVRAAGALAAYPQMLLEKDPGEKAPAQWENAKKELIDSMSIRPDHWDSHYNLGNYHLETGNPSAALQDYEIALRLEPRAVMVQVNSSIALARLGQNDRAEEILQRALKLAPDNPAAHFNLGLLEAEKKETSVAEEHLRAALKADPEMHAAAYNLGLLLANSRPREALELMGRAYGKLKCPKYAYTLAFYLNANGEPDQAAAILKDALKIWPVFVEADLLLKQILASQDRPK